MAEDRHPPLARMLPMLSPSRSASDAAPLRKACQDAWIGHPLVVLPAGLVMVRWSRSVEVAWWMGMLKS